MNTKRFCIMAVSFLILLTSGSLRAATPGFLQTNLVSDISGLAAVTDPDLKNPWGIAFSATSPFWVADNGTGLSTIYTGQGTKLGLVVTIPPPPGSSAGTLAAPTGVVFNGASGFSGDHFLFASEGGTIAGWQSGTVAATRVDNSPQGSVYKGLAINNGLIYATDFHNNHVDVFDSNYSPVTLAGGFTDPNLPAGFAPFGIRNLGGNIYVTYAKQLPGAHDDDPGPGNGFVDTFDANGVLLGRLITQGPLNSPWGLALAPSGFGAFGNSLLVGNFGDGVINAFDPLTGAFIDTLRDTGGNPLAIDGLWSLAFGNGANGFSPDTLYFTAGLNGEADGLFGSLHSTVPEPSTLILLGGAIVGCLAFRRARRT